MKLLLQTVLSLAQHKTSAGNPDGQLLNEASNKFTRFDELDLERFFKSHPEKGNTSEAGKYVFLPMVPKPRLLPILNLAYDLQDDRVRLQLVLFVEREVASKARAFGYRYESPEGEGRHCYWHAQPIHHVKLHDDTTIELPGLKDGWRPIDTPAFPLDARCAIDLLFCLMVSLYGFQEVATMQADYFENSLATQIRRMRSPI
jgi:hypothetical protein